MYSLFPDFTKFFNKKIEEFNKTAEEIIKNAGKPGYDVHFRVNGEDGKPVIDTDDPDEFFSFVKKLSEKSEVKDDAEKEKSADKSDAAGDSKKVCGECDGDCDNCGCCDEADFEDELVCEPEAVRIFEIPVSGVLAVAALIGSVGVLINAIRRK